MGKGLLGAARVHPAQNRLWTLQNQELAYLDLPQLLRLVQAALVHHGGKWGSDGAQADPLLSGQDGLSGMLLYTRLFHEMDLPKKNQVRQILSLTLFQQRAVLEDGQLEYRGRGVCNCATSTKRKLEHCDADDKQSDIIIAWSLPHTADRFLKF